MTQVTTTLTLSEVVHKPPERACRRKSGDVKKPAEYGIQADVNKMPDSIETNKQ